MTTTPESILKSVFGYDQFRPLQAEVIANVLNKQNTLAIMPTGGGKSLCYQIPALIFPGLTVVVSPLIALMKDQVEQLHELGVAALFLNSSLSPGEYQGNMDRVRRGEIKLLYVAPETLMTPRLFNLLGSLPLDCLTIDEAHCISEWGHDFRPEYRQLASARERFPRAVCLALTATATQRVRQDIKATLGFDEANEFLASFDRPNLLIEVNPKTDPAAQTLEFLRRYADQSGIIYCFSRKQVDDLTVFLAGKGYSVRSYHAGLEDAVRKENQELFIRDDVQIIVATIAFGMGINKPNVRFVIHYDLPKSIEGYYQEIGRAGRDGLPAHCLLLYSASDAAKLRYFINQKEESERQVAYQHLHALTAYAMTTTCRRIPLLAYFGETAVGQHCDHCDNCLQGDDAQIDVTVAAQKFMSCVKRSGERFAATHITHILLGVDNEKVLKNGHQTLSTFGIGKELTRKQWLHLAQQLVEQQLLEQSPDMYRVLKLTPRAYEALKNRTPIQGILLEEARAEKSGKAGEVIHDPALFEVLRKKRKELADATNVPPYIIFSDRTLVEMAAYYPQSATSLTKINGVGQVKLERYGETFLALIAEYCRARNLQEKRKPAGQESQAQGQMALNPRHRVVGEAFNAGQSVADLMAAYGVQRGTILDHLARFIQEGHALRQGNDLLDLLNLPADQLSAAVQAFDELGTEYLRPVFERLEGVINYDTLKIVRLYCLTRPASGRERVQD